MGYELTYGGEYIKDALTLIGMAMVIAPLLFYVIRPRDGRKNSRPIKYTAKR